MPEGSYEGSDRRKNKRLRKPFSLRLQVQDGQTSTPWDMVIVKDISRDSLSFTYDRSLSIGARLLFKLNFGYERGTIQCEAQVVRAQELRNTKVYEIGVRLTNISETDSHLIDEAVLQFYSK